MSSSTRIDGSLPDAGVSPTTGIVFSRGWAVQYDWSADSVAGSGQPSRLKSLRFPPPFDSDLDGVLRGQGAFAGFLYLFKGGKYLRLVEATMTPDQPAKDTPKAWDLPAGWTKLDAVFPGGGKKSGFAYFFHHDQYVRYEWAKDKRSAGYPKRIASEWHMPAGFDRDIDGVIVGQDAFSTKAYFFKTISRTVDRDGNLVAAHTPGSTVVRCPVYTRYDFDTEKNELVVDNPATVVGNWNGLLPLLDAGPAVDTALIWCDGAITALAGGSPPSAALGHHFMTASPTPAQLSSISTRTTAVRARINNIPTGFSYNSALTVAAQTTPATLTEVGDPFSTHLGPNGRAAVQIHEAVHFTFTGGAAVDVPEWSGETVNGVAFGVDSISHLVYHTISTAQAIANPSSYAAFAQEVTLHGDTRFGDARRQQ
jgi:hypothetical protein